MSRLLRAGWLPLAVLLAAPPLQEAIGAAAPSAAVGQPLQLTTGNDYPPFTATNLPEGGLATDIVREAFRRSGLEVKIDWLPWARGLYEAQAGHYAATFPYIHTRERDDTFLFSDPLYDLAETLFVRKGLVIDPNQAGTLRGRIFCLPVGWGVTGKLETLRNNRLVIMVRPPDIRQCVKMLQAGHADFFPSDLRQGLASLAEAGAKEGDVQPLSPPLQYTGVHLIVSRHLPGAGELVGRFNRGLKALRTDGDYDRIVAAHGPAAKASPTPTLPAP